MSSGADFGEYAERTAEAAAAQDVPAENHGSGEEGGGQREVNDGGGTRIV